MIRILVVDDESVIRKGFEKAFEKHKAHYEIVGVPSGEDAVARLTEEAFDLVFTDLKMPGMDGIEVIRRSKEIRPGTDVVMMTGYSTVESAVDAMKYGALDYILKPFTQSELLGIVNKAERIRNSRIRSDEEGLGFQRWNINLRLQHLVMILTFSILTITGVPLLFPAVFEGVFFFDGSSYLRGLTHRLSAGGMILLSVYHVGYVLFTEDGHHNLREMLPKPLTDLKAMFGLIMYTAGRRTEKPKAGRYDVLEKFEYFAVVWGTVVMVVSGFMLWFAENLFHILPMWALDVAKVVHRLEAVLAILSILIWHTYHVHLKPGVFPGLTVWWNGRVSREYMIEHHPLEYEAVTGRPAVIDEHREPLAETSTPDSDGSDQEVL